MNEQILCHKGVKERSGRYPWGSGGRPYQRLETSYGSRRKRSNITRKAKKIARKVGRVTKTGLIRFNKYPLQFMSDEELNARIQRLRAEDTLKQLLGQKTKKEIKAEMDQYEKTVNSAIGKVIEGAIDKVGDFSITSGLDVLKNMLPEGREKADEAERRKEEQKKKDKEIRETAESIATSSDEEIEKAIKRIMQKNQYLQEYSRLYDYRHQHTPVNANGNNNGGNGQGQPGGKKKNKKRNNGGGGGH